MKTLRMNTDADGIVTVWIDVPDKSVNTIGRALLDDLADVLITLERDKPAGVVFTSAKKHSFVAGADLFEIRGMGREQVMRFLADGQALFERIARLRSPTVAAINGDCLGGGLELCLACTTRVAADDTSISIGLPEIKLGILPAWGGTTRLPRVIGLPKALPLLLAGKTMPPRKAMKAGIVDEVVRPEALLEAAKRRLREIKPRRLSIAQRTAAAVPFARNRILAAALKQTEAQAHGNYPAPLRLLDVVRIGYERGFEAGLAAERTALADLMQTDAATNLLRLFFLRQGAKRVITKQVHARPADVRYAAVIGGGTMGAGICHALAKAGINVRLVEVDPKAVSAALGRIRKMFDDDVAAGRLTTLDSRHAFNRVAPTTDWTGLELADLVVEAVLEEIGVKREVFAKLDRMTRADCVLASNTSSLSINAMAQGTLHPQRVVGLHFFNPVPKMPLVEVVRGPQSGDAALATAAALAGRIGKTPVIVNDAPGFLVNRVLIPYLAEALEAAKDGVPIDKIDRAMKQWGMPMGPFELVDEIGLDVAAHVLRTLNLRPGERTDSAILDRARENGWLGKKSGRGFYIHTDGRKSSREIEVNDELTSLMAGQNERPPAALAVDEEIQWRLILPMVNEAARLLAEGVIDSTDTIDLATVLGTGFAPFRGGLARFADTVGIGKIVGKLEELRQRHGPRFEPAALLLQLAEAQRPLADFRGTGAPAVSVPRSTGFQPVPGEQKTEEPTTSR